jgi:plastocyanin
VQVSKSDGKPLAGAVVLLHGPPGSRPAAPAQFIVDQVNQTFVPDLTVIPLGSTVKFPNSDKVSHQVYSFSAAKRFQLPLYRGTPYEPITFANPGIVTLGCNIHDDMIAYLVVTDAGWYGRTDDAGIWIAPDLPEGNFRMEIWHPRMREAAAMIERQVNLSVASPRRLDVRLERSLRPEPLGLKPHSWSDY